MPTYEYVCSVCDTGVEVMHGIHDKGPATCAVCSGPMRKALSAPAIHFKGTGWAKKDARAAARPTSSGQTEGSTPSATGEAAASPDAAVSPSSSADQPAAPKPAASTATAE